MPRKLATRKRQSYCVFNRVTKKQKYNQLSTAHGFSSGSVFIGICFCLVGIWYLFTVNCVTTKGNQITQLTQNIKELESENEKLLLREAELRSLDKVGEAVKDKMQVISDPTYIDSEDLIVSK